MADIRRRPAAFTLVELLVVVAILAVLMALLVPAVQAARESSRRSQCGNNLKQLATAAEAHRTLLGHLPTGGWDGASLTATGNGADWHQPRGWCYGVLPFMEMKNAYDSLDCSTPVPVFVCPTRRGTSVGTGGMVMTDYAANRGAWTSPTPAANATTNRTTVFGWQAGASTLPTAGDGWAAVAQTINAPQPVLLGTGAVPTGGVIFAGSATPAAALRDGASSTYLCAEKYVPRTAYASGPTGYSLCAYVGDSPDTLRGGHRPPESDATAFVTGMEGSFGGPHASVFMAAMCDGSVRTIDLGIDPAVHFLLACRADRQPAQVPD
jgi:prepilin-type N-terminal cleavage/methylation domain-containing protein